MVTIYAVRVNAPLAENRERRYLGIMYSRITNGIYVTVEPTYLENYSSPTEDQYVWAYQVRIENRSAETVQLKTRTWSITDADGHTQVVHGEGVVGQEPVIPPGDAFEYTSGTPLATPSGIMNGTYGMLGDGGHMFDVIVPAFSLDSPYDRRKAN